MKRNEFAMNENGFTLTMTVSGKEREAALESERFPKMYCNKTVTHNGEQAGYNKRNQMLHEFYEIARVCRMAWPRDIFDMYGRRIGEYTWTEADHVSDDCPLKEVFDERLQYLEQETVTTYTFHRISGKPHKKAQAKDGSYYVEAEHLPEILEAIRACEKRASARTLDWDMTDLIKWITNGCQPVSTFEKMPKSYKYKVSYTWIKLNKAGNIIFGRDEAWGN